MAAVGAVPDQPDPLKQPPGVQVGVGATALEVSYIQYSPRPDPLSVSLLTVKETELLVVKKVPAVVAVEINVTVGVVGAIESTVIVRERVAVLTLRAGSEVQK